MTAVSVKSAGNMTHVVTSDRHTLIVDEPPPRGDDRGMDPYELLLASLGS